MSITAKVTVDSDSIIRSCHAKINRIKAYREKQKEEFIQQRTGESCGFLWLHKRTREEAIAFADEIENRHRLYGYAGCEWVTAYEQSVVACTIIGNMAKYTTSMELDYETFSAVGLARNELS